MNTFGITAEDLLNGVKVPIKDWSEVRDGDWIHHSSWANGMYRCQVTPTRIGLDMVFTRTPSGESFYPYNYPNWINKELTGGPSCKGFLIISLSKDYDPSQQPWDEDDI